MSSESPRYPSNGASRPAYPNGHNLPAPGEYQASRAPHADPPSPWSGSDSDDNTTEDDSQLRMNAHAMGNGMRPLPPGVRLLPTHVQLTLRPPQPIQPQPYAHEDDDDEDVDQLDSDTDENVDVESSMQVDGPQGVSGNGVTVKRKRRSSVRKQGQSLLPQSLMESILLADGSAGLNMSKEALYVVSIATEEFIKRLSRDAQHRAALERRTAVNYRDISSCTLRRGFTFLQDVIPQPIPISIALQRRATKDDDVLDEEPPISILPSASAIPPSVSASYAGSGTISIPAMHSQNYVHSENARLAHSTTAGYGQLKLKISRPTLNGQEKVNGKSEAAKLRKRDSRGRWSTSRSGSGRITRTDAESASGSSFSRDPTAPNSASQVQPRSSRRTSASRANSASTTSEVFTHEPHWTALQTTPSNGSSMEPPESYERGAPPPAPTPAVGTISLSAGLGLGRARHSPLGEGSWAGYTTAPASGFLGSSGGNPGRTIYSMQRERRSSNAGSQR